MRFRKIYLEISNVCNLHCSFCPGTKRKKGRMTKEDLAVLLPKLRPYAEFLYFHLMGEPLCHPELEDFLRLAGAFGFKVILTTNGTLVRQKQEMLCKAEALHKVNLSVHAFEANDFSLPLEEYVQSLCEFGKATQKLVVFRLWNVGGKDALNEKILGIFEKNFPKPWASVRQGFRLGEKTYLEYGDTFDWPDLALEADNAPMFCYGLRDQIGVLWDGTVVPCCLDHEGDIPLGNLFTQELQEILESPRAKAIYEGFSGKQAVEALCKTCGYARRFE